VVELEDKLVRVREQETREAIEENRVRYEATRNPLYAWQALAALFALNRLRRRAGQDAMPLPHWCEEYLGIIARRLADLAEGLDFREAPQPFGRLPRTAEALQRTHRRRRTVPPDRAREQVPAALGLVRKGWNAFERAQALREKELDELGAELFRMVGGKGEAEAVEMLLDEHGERAERQGTEPAISGVRSARKRIAEARRARRPKPTP
jgi:hypothetical protein